MPGFWSRIKQSLRSAAQRQADTKRMRQLTYCCIRNLFEDDPEAIAGALYYCPMCNGQLRYDGEVWFLIFVPEDLQPELSDDDHRQIAAFVELQKASYEKLSWAEKNTVPPPELILRSHRFSHRGHYLGEQGSNGEKLPHLSTAPPGYPLKKPYKMNRSKYS